jgi:endonuclease/exonuclease/phosphatase family metal-dependent hydrolase
LSGFAAPADTETPSLSFDQLIALAAQDPLPPDLESKLMEVLSTPTVVNRGGGFSAKDNPSSRDDNLRVAEWNINRGENESAVQFALSDLPAFLQLAGKQGPVQNADRLRAELAELQKADIVILDEVDDGVKRTRYRNVAQDLANALHMNYTYGVEFIELNRIYLGARHMDNPERSVANADGQIFGLDPTRYRGFEGSAILSRYPIRSARIVRLPQVYDWYHSEIKAVSQLEKARRWSAEQLFEERVARQVRRGGRMALIADLEVPSSPTGLISVICPHLEDYAGSKRRREQLRYLLAQSRTLANPVILAGDLNTTGRNGRPVVAKQLLFRYLLNYRVVIRETVFFVTPVPGLGLILRAANYWKNYHDPTALNIPIFLPNRSKQIFAEIRKFRFEDGTNFDFSGIRERSFAGRRKTLADSNQRAWKGFVPTFQFQRTYHHLVGEYKLDWIFVKPSTTALPSGSAASSAFRPRAGRTLQDVNYALEKRISDHAPITAVISLPGK